MSSAAVDVRCNPEEYLARERESPFKSEYYNGRVYAVAGASREHNLIVFNLAAEIGAQLRGKPCEAYAADMRVKSQATSAYAYPDVVIVCGEPQFEDTGLDTLINPTVLIEVASPSTEADDRGHKFAHYRRIPSLQEYVLVAQERAHVERWMRQGEGWLMMEMNDLAEELALASVGCAIPLSLLYEKVALKAEAEAGES